MANTVTSVPGTYGFLSRGSPGAPQIVLISGSVQSKVNLHRAPGAPRFRGVSVDSCPHLSLPSEHLGTKPDMFDKLRSLLKCDSVTEDFPDHHF